MNYVLICVMTSSLGFVQCPVGGYTDQSHILVAPMSDKIEKIPGATRRAWAKRFRLKSSVTGPNHEVLKGHHHRADSLQHGGTDEGTRMSGYNHTVHPASEIRRVRLVSVGEPVYLCWNHEVAYFIRGNRRSVDYANKEIAKQYWNAGLNVWR